MKVAKSISAKVTLSIVLISCVVVSAIVSIDAVNVNSLMKQQIRHAAETEADLAFIGIEKPMLVGDNNATKMEFSTIKRKFKDMSVYLTSYSGNVTYSTDEGAIRKDLGNILQNGVLNELHRRGLKQPVRETALVHEDGRDMLARVISIPNEARCHHCHGASHPFVGQLVVLTDVTSQWSLMRQQTYVSIGVGVVGLVLLVTASILIIRKICVNAIRCLALLANKVASGDFSVSFQSKREDEIGQLSLSLHTMLEHIKTMMHEADISNRDLSEKTARIEHALAEVERAKQEAERATHDGRLQAACQLEDVTHILTATSEKLYEQIAHSSQGAHEQAGRASEVATAMEQMNATVLEVSRNAAQAAETTDKARGQAENGASVVNKVVRGIDHLQRQALTMKEGMSTLGEQAEGIGQVMNVISDIADQTNLLALNAAIEAARAGEAGRGFAVVADEVRKLAEKTMSATREVGQAIHNIQQGARSNIDSVENTVRTIEEATALANESGHALTEIVTLVGLATDQVRSIAIASEQQSSASAEINCNIDGVNAICSGTSIAMRACSEGVEELARQAQVLKKLIEDLKQDGTGIGRKGPLVPGLVSRQ